MGQNRLRSPPSSVLLRPSKAQSATVRLPHLPLLLSARSDRMNANTRMAHIRQTANPYLTTSCTTSSLATVASICNPTQRRLAAASPKP